MKGPALDDHQQTPGRLYAVTVDVGGTRRTSRAPSPGAMVIEGKPRRTSRAWPAAGRAALFLVLGGTSWIMCLAAAGMVRRLVA